MKPFVSCNRNRAEFLANYFLLSLTYFTVLFTNSALPFTASYKIGHYMIIYFFVVAFINLLLIVYHMCVAVKFIAMKWWVSCKRLKGNRKQQAESSATYRLELEPIPEEEEQKSSLLSEITRPPGSGPKIPRPNMKYFPLSKARSLFD